MGSRLRRGLAIGAAAVVALLVLLVAILHTPPVRSRALAWVITTLESRFSLVLSADRLTYNLLSGGVTLTNVRLAAKTAADRPFFTAARVQANVPLAAYAGRLILDDVAVDSGRFTISDLPAGRFTLTVTRASFVTSVYGAKRPGRPGTPIVVTTGARITDVTVRIWRGAVIAGAIRDEMGAPVANVPVTATPARDVPAGGILTLSNNGATTNDQGEYRIFGLEPGTYVVSVQASNAAGLGPESAAQVLTVPIIPALPGAPTGLAALVAGGGNGPVIVIQQTRYTCPGPSLPDPTIYQTIGTSGTSVINPSGGIVIKGQ